MLEHKKKQPSSNTPISPLRIATWNLNNFGKKINEYGQFQTRAMGKCLATVANNPHIIAVQEMCDDSGVTDDGTVLASANAQRLINAIRLAGGKDYQYIDVPPDNNADGGLPGANIRCGYLYRPDRVALVAGNADGSNPAALGGDNPVFEHSRKPLMAHFKDTLTGEDYRIINVHFASDGSRARARADGGAYQPRMAEWQPNQERLQKRLTQMHVVASYVDDLQQRYDVGDGNHLIVCGDFNAASHVHRLGLRDDSHDHPRELGILENTGLCNAISEPRTTVDDGELAMTLDYIYVSPTLKRRIADEAVLSMNHGSKNHRISDHNPTMIAVKAPEQAHAPSQRDR